MKTKNQISSFPRSVAANDGAKDALPLYSTATRARSADSRGFSLIEAMVAMVLLSFLILGIFAGMMLAYRIAASTRYRDHARYILRSIGDQFLVQMAEQDGDLLPLFTITSGPTGTGLTWQGVTAATDGGTPDTTLHVTLGTLDDSTDSTDPVIRDAVLTRDVRYLSDTGTIASTPPDSTGGMLLRGDFKISYTYNGKPIEQSLSLVRRVP